MHGAAWAAGALYVFGGVDAHGALRPELCGVCVCVRVCVCVCACVRVCVRE